MKPSKTSSVPNIERLEDEAVALMAFDGSDGPAFPQDDLHRRRWVNDIVEQVSAQGVLGVKQPKQKGFEPSMYWRVFAAAVSFVAIALIGVFIWRIEWNEELAPSLPVVHSDFESSSSVGRVAMITGSVSAYGTPIFANHSLHAGEEIRTQSGNAAVHLAGGVVVYLDAQTAVTLTRPNIQPAQILLRKGRIVAAVDKSNNGQVAFTVATFNGRVDVTGTLFSMEAKQADVTVQVLKGTVLATDNSKHTKKVSGGHALVLGAHDVRPLAVEEVASLQEGKLLLAPFRASKIPLDEAIEPQQIPVEPTSVDRTATTSSAKVEPDVAVKEQHSLAPVHNHMSLMTIARQHRQAKDWDGAVKTYQLILQQSEDFTELGIALNALGDLLLEYKGQPLSALVYYDKYLAQHPNGVLAQEAAFGRIRALKQLNRFSDEAVALQEFIDVYPKAVQTSLVQKRLWELEQIPTD